ncbi:MAG: S-layer homology domain-containing protein, partial [Clostridiales bacterium]|nr:S-layer homology domain-containing protein [Clostridiales bacterium]
ADYTADSWAAYSGALGVAGIAVADADATQLNVDHAAQSLISAIGSLARLSGDDYAAAAGVLAAIKAAVAEDARYTAESLAELAGATERAPLASALGGLALRPLPLKPGALNAAIAATSAAALTERLYTPQTWEALATALVSAQLRIAYGQHGDQATIDADFGQIISALKALALAPAASGANKALLDMYTERAAALSAQAYTAASWQALAQALAAARIVAADGGAGQAAVDEAARALVGAIDALARVADKAALRAEIERARSIANEGYTGESWKYLTDALANAMAVLDRETATQPEVNAAAGELGIAIGGLRVADKAALEAEIARAEALAQGNYTGVTWGNMQTVLAVARAVAAQADATQKAVDEAASALAAVIGALRAPDSGAPGTPGTETARRYATIGVADPGAHDGQTSVYYASRRLELSESETAFTLLQKTGLGIKYAGHREHAGYYVEEINGFGEFDDGPRSGWMYSVNGAFPNYSSSLYYLQDGDTVRWLYTRELGGDIDASYAIDSDPAPASPGTPTETGANSAGSTAATAGPDTPLAASAGGGPNIVAQVTVDAATATPDASGRATAKPDAAKVAAAVAEAKKAADEARAGGRADAVAEVVIPVKTEGGTAAKSIETELAAEAIKAAADAKDVILTIESDVLTLTLDAAALATGAGSLGNGDAVVIAARAAGAETLNASQRAAAGGNPVIELAITAGGTAIGDLKGTASVSVPYKPEAATVAEDYDLLTVYKLEPDGSYAEAKGARYDAASGSAVFTAAATGAYFVSEWISPFGDIQKDAWYYRAARYAHSNGLMNGTGNGFEPQATLTRAMLVTILARESGIDTSGGGTWYSAALEWGVAGGITDGTDPDGAITREQFAAMLYRYAGSPEAGASFAGYADADSVSSWAGDAMAWAVSNGLIQGRTTTALTPTVTTTRAEAAAMLQRYLEQAA